MKRRFLFMFLIIASIFLFTSCPQDIESLPDEEVDGDETISFYLPTFATAEVSGGGVARGLMDMGVFTGENMLAGCSIMSYIPVIQALESAEMTVSDLRETIFTRYVNFTAYGFDCSLYKDSIKITKDFLYLRFYVQNDVSIVGVVDYALDIRNKRFSFREIMTLTLDFPDFGYQNTSLLVIEYNDIPVNWDGSFTTAEFLDDGSLKKNVITDLLSVGNNQNHDVFLQRYYAVAKSDNDIISIFLRPYDKESYAVDIGDNARKVLIEAIGDNLKVDNDAEASEFSHKICQHLLPEYYENGRSLTHHDPRNGYEDYKVYGSYEEYQADSISKLKKLNEEQEAFNNGEEFIIFNYKNLENATLRTGSSITDPYQNYLRGNLTKEELEKKGFAKFYPELFSSEDFTIEKFIETHLRACGIEDENYISNFISAWKEAYSGIDYNEHSQYPKWESIVTNMPIVN